MSKTESILEAKLPQLKTPLPGPNARRIIDGDARLISPSYTRSYPLVIRRGRGGLRARLAGAGLRGQHPAAGSSAGHRSGAS